MGRGFEPRLRQIPGAARWRCANASACDPPTYNSVGYILLGLALCQHANLSSWEELEQLEAALPPALLPACAPTRIERGTFTHSLARACF
jgi:hypothetical protein